MKVWNIKIEYNDILTARAKTETLMKAIKNKPGSRFNTNEEENRYYGFLGEGLSQNYFVRENIPFETDDAIGRKDLFDFKIKNKTVDVKTAVIKWKPDSKTEIFINKDQAINPSCDIYFFVIINKGFAYFPGYIFKEDISDYEVKQGKYSEVVVFPVKKLRQLRGFKNELLG